MEKSIQSPEAKVSRERSEMPSASTSRMTSQGLSCAQPGDPSGSCADAAEAKNSTARDATKSRDGTRMASLQKDGGKGEEGWGAEGTEARESDFQALDDSESESDSLSDSRSESSSASSSESSPWRWSATSSRTDCHLACRPSRRSCR